MTEAGYARCPFRRWRPPIDLEPKSRRWRRHRLSSKTSVPGVIKEPAKIVLRFH
jgi:hypothetical protein